MRALDLDKPPELQPVATTAPVTTIEPVARARRRTTVETTEPLLVQRGQEHKELSINDSIMNVARELDDLRRVVDKLQGRTDETD